MREDAEVLKEIARLKDVRDRYDRIIAGIRELTKRYNKMLEKVCVSDTERNILGELNEIRLLKEESEEIIRRRSDGRGTRDS